MRKTLLAALALGTLSAAMAAPASADILMPGQWTVSYCFEISNISEYPDYAFIVHFAEPIGGHQMIEQGKCVQFYKLVRPVIYAVPKAGFSPSEIPDGGRDKPAEKNYFDTNPKLLKSDVRIVSLNTVDEKDPRSEAVDVLRITGMSGRTLDIRKDSIRYVYTNGARETLPYASQDVHPEPSNIPAPWYTYWYLGLPVVALSGIAAVFLGAAPKAVIGRFQTEIAFGLTLLVESGILVAIVRRPLPKLLLYAALVNGVSWPLATYGHQRFSIPYWPAELAVWVAEGLLLKLLLECGYQRAMAIALAMNLPTALIGWYAREAFAG